MLTKLTLEDFKNFQHAELELGAFTVLIGANATGKSNVRDAFRFLHGIGRGYTFSEIISEKWIEGGVRIWQGIRGGLYEICYMNSHQFSITVDGLPHTANNFSAYPLRYGIVVALAEGKQEIGFVHDFIGYGADSSEEHWQAYKKQLVVEGIRKWDQGTESRRSGLVTNTNQENGIRIGKDESATTDFFKKIFNSIRFFDFVPDAMRMPSTMTLTVLGDRGENLSSVLYAICQDPQRKEILLSWVEDLTPMDAVDFEFPSDQIGRILATVVERTGQRISAYSMSDGTLRFLAILAAFLGPERAKFYFLEELENGIHPTRLHLLTQFIENQVAQGDIQVVATTHSPLLLNYLKPETLENASILYRLENQPDAHIKRLVDIPDARQLIEKQSVMRLYESGWFEDALFFMDDEGSIDEAEVAT